jgi:hypothetical protein
VGVVSVCVTLVFKELLDMHKDDHLGPVSLDVRRETPWKIGIVFKIELEAIIETGGECDAEFYKLAVMIAHMLASDTQEVEGINGTIKHVLSHFPAIGQKLLSTRTLCKKVLSDALGPLATLKMMPMVCDKIDNIVDSCLPLHSEGKIADADKDRFFNLGENDPLAIEDAKVRVLALPNGASAHVAPPGLVQM